VEPRLEHPLAAVMRKVDLFVPMLTGDPTSKGADIVAYLWARAANRQSMTEDQGLHPVIRESYFTLIILVRLLQLKLTALKPPCSKCHSHQISEIELLWREWACLTVRLVTVTAVTRLSQPSPGLAAGAFSLWAVVLAALKLRQSSAAVATRREGHRSPRCPAILPQQ
jgi:hypothetical protein